MPSFGCQFPFSSQELSRHLPNGKQAHLADAGLDHEDLGGPMVLDDLARQLIAEVTRVEPNKFALKKEEENV